MLYLIIITQVLRDIGLMKKSPTLPSIKQKQQPTRSGLQSKETFRKIEHRVNFHDEQIVKNEKIISTLANEFRLLKQQLDFEQQYSEQYKISLDKYEEECNRQQRTIKDQKTMILKLEQNLKQKEKHIQTLAKDSKHSQKKVQELQIASQQLKKNMKKREEELKSWEIQKEKLLRKLKQREEQYTQLKNKLEAKSNDNQHLLEKLRNEVDSLSSQIQKNKQDLLSKQSQIHHLTNWNAKLNQQIQSFERKESQLIPLKEQYERLRTANQQLVQLHAQCEAKLAEQSSKNKNNQEKIDILTEKIKQLKKQSESEKQQLKKALSKYEALRSTAEANAASKDKLVKESQQWKLKAMSLEKRFVELASLKTKIGQNLKSIQKSTICQLCRKAMKNPVTNIPCGHSFCLDCKKGYEKQCIKCPGIKREAVYRNELLDDIVQAAHLIDNILKQLEPS